MTEKVKIAVLVSGGGTNLQALIDADNPYGEIALVISSKKDVYALERARLADIPSVVVSKVKYKTGFAAKLIETLREHHIQLIVLAGYLTILPDEVINAYDHRIINIHPALLPSFGGIGMYGLAVHEAVLARGVRVTGATVHYVNEIPDGGRIIAQKAVCVLPDDTPEILQRRVMEEAEWVILPDAVRGVCGQLTEVKYNG
jgi:phosphoribosylglycinamide formyltransferase-1